MGVYHKYRDSKGRKCGPWFVQYPDRVDPQTGKTVWKTIKHGFSKQVVQRFLEAKKTELLERRERGVAHRRPETFQDLMDWYLERAEVKSLANYYNLGFQSRKLKSHFGNLRADRIQPTDVEEFRSSMLSEGYSPAYVNRHIALMRRAYNVAIRDRRVEQNPCLGVRQLSEGNVRDRVLSEEEWQRLQEDLAPHANAMVKFAYYTGMRWGEVATLTWDRVNLSEGWIRLRSQDTKTKQARRVYLTHQARDVLSEASRVRSLKSDRVFLNRGEPIRDIRTAFENACDRAGIRDFRFHDLRHCFVTNMRRAGVPRSVIMAMTGHKSESMFLRYNAIKEQDIRTAVERAEEYFRGQDYFLVTPEAEKEQTQSVSKTS